VTLPRRSFLAGALAAAGVAAVGCTGGEGDGSRARVPGPRLPDGLTAGDVPENDTIYGWIEEIVDLGVRRPGYEADVRAEELLVERLEEWGLDVHVEPVEVTRWEPVAWSLVALPADGEPRELDCFPLPYTAPTEEIELDLVSFSGTEIVAGKGALVDAPLVRTAPTGFVGLGSAPTDPAARAERVYDPEGTFAGEEHVLPHTVARNRVADAAVEAGAAAFIGVLSDHPTDSCRYFVPYDGRARPLPGVWVAGSDGVWLATQLAAGPVRIRLTVDSTSEPFTSNTVVGELEGADDEVVMIGSHHDGPWASAVEDASGTALVLAQAAFWSAQPIAQRPHRLRFILQAGHMCGGAGARTYVVDHADELDDVVLELHLEHAALEPGTGRCTPRWFFTSRIPALEGAVIDALRTEDLARSLLLAPDALGERPPTDGGVFHSAGVPVVQFLAAPFYLFDEIDTLDKIDRAHLTPLSRATIRLVAATAGVTAADLRSQAVQA
jgi:hypothetical protein